MHALPVLGATSHLEYSLWCYGVYYESVQAGCRIYSISLRPIRPIYIRVFILAKIVQPFSRPFILIEIQKETG